MSDTKELVERLNGENPDKVVATDRLRMFAHDPETFEFDQHDALSLIPTIEEAASAIERTETENGTLRARVARLEAELAGLLDAYSHWFAPGNPWADKARATLKETAP